MSNKLASLSKLSTVVADTGDIDAIMSFSPEDATTNPSLIYKAAQIPSYEPLIKETLEWAMQRAGDSPDFVDILIDKLAVNIGKEILKVIPGRISTEVDARLSFDTNKTVERARKLVNFYQEAGVSKSRILIKIASTWEGIQACKVLERENIKCNMTLIFSKYQAIAAAQAGATLISPFVGRIYDWYKKNEGRDYPPDEDPGVKSVQEIYQYYKKFGHETIIMGASFRTTGQIIELAGCDRITISPNLLEELQNTPGDVEVKLSPNMELPEDLESIDLDEKTFRWQMNEDAMATEKLAEGIRNFSADLIKLENYLRKF